MHKPHFQLHQLHPCPPDITKKIQNNNVIVRPRGRQSIQGLYYSPMKHHQHMQVIEMEHSNEGYTLLLVYNLGIDQV